MAIYLDSFQSFWGRERRIWQMCKVRGSPPYSLKQLAILNISCVYLFVELYAGIRVDIIYVCSLGARTFAIKRLTNRERYTLCMSVGVFVFVYPIGDG